jgi:hypothetical protein
MSEPTYTLAEAKRELARRECGDDGHRPSNRFSTLCDRIGWWICDCGAVAWEPRERPQAPGRTQQTNTNPTTHQDTP